MNFEDSPMKNLHESPQNIQKKLFATAPSPPMHAFRFVYVLWIGNFLSFRNSNYCHRCSPHQTNHRPIIGSTR